MMTGRRIVPPANFLVAVGPLHGFPLRALVPGSIGARSVKWLTRITLGEEPSRNYFQRKAYRLLPPGSGTFVRSKST